MPHPPCVAYRFVIADGTPFDDSLADAVFRAGGGDILLFRRDGRTYAEFEPPHCQSAAVPWSEWENAIQAAKERLAAQGVVVVGGDLVCHHAVSAASGLAPPLTRPGAIPMETYREEDHPALAAENLSRDPERARIEAELYRRVYDAFEILQEMESAGKIRGGIRDDRQRVAERAVHWLRQRWVAI